MKTKLIVLGVLALAILLVFSEQLGSYKNELISFFDQKTNQRTPAEDLQPEIDISITNGMSAADFKKIFGEPKGEIKAYLDWIMSDKGQCLIFKKGYAPVKKVTCN